MTIRHHASEETLAAFAAGTLDEARALVVATHVALCPQCRGGVRMLEAVGGALLTATEPAPLADGALGRALARLDDAPPQSAMRANAGRLPSPLADYPLGPWKRIGRGVQLRAVGMPEADDMRVFMLRAEPGTRLPRHRHRGDEWTCVIEGAFTHAGGRYGPGDMDEADADIEHHPFVEREGPCLCLVALEGGIVFQSWLGRLVQPFVRL